MLFRLRNMYNTFSLSKLKYKYFGSVDTGILFPTLILFDKKDITTTMLKNVTNTNRYYACLVEIH